MLTSKRMKNYIFKNIIFHSKDENHIDSSFLRGTIYHKNWQYCKKGIKNLIFSIDTVVRLFVYYQRSKITHKNENSWPFTSPRVENKLLKSNSQKISMIFLNTISPNRCSDFGDNFVSFSD